MKLNQSAVRHAERLIRDGKVDRESDWSEEQPHARDERAYFEKEGADAYARWFLGIDPDEPEGSRERHKFPFGDFRRVHRKGLIAAKQRAAQNDYADIERAADNLLALIDRLDSR